MINILLNAGDTLCVRCRGCAANESVRPARLARLDRRVFPEGNTL